MPADERRRRMRAMRHVVAGHDVFAWASDILEGLEQIRPRPRQVRGADVEGSHHSLPVSGAAASTSDGRH